MQRAVALTTVGEAGSPSSKTVERHLASGGLAGRVEAGVEGEVLVVRRGSESIVCLPVAEIPITWQGAARMHVANALAAAMGAVALGVSGEAIADGLRSFRSSPGRVERHQIEGREIILDYSHNIAALRALGELVERIADGRRVIGVVSMPGDRRDADRVEFGALAGTLFDQLFVAEPAVRGRPTGEAAGLLIEAAAHAADGGPSRCGQPTFVPDEADATRAAFAESAPGDLLVLCVATARACWPASNRRPACSKVGSMTRALILAGGGILGIAWESGVLAGLEAAGIDTQDWGLVVGTSAGAYVGARLTVDGSPAPLFALETSGNDASVEADLRMLFGPGFVRATRLSRHPALRWVSWLWLATFAATTLTRFAARRGVGAAISLVDSLRTVRETGHRRDVAGAHGGPSAVGHGQPVHPPALPGLMRWLTGTVLVGIGARVALERG